MLYILPRFSGFLEKSNLAVSSGFSGVELLNAFDAVMQMGFYLGFVFAIIVLLYFNLSISELRLVIARRDRGLLHGN